MKKVVIIFITVLILLIGLSMIYYLGNGSNVTVTNFEECEKAGYLVLESYPAQCRTPDGKSFTQDIGNEFEVIDFISVSSPRPGQNITSPLTGTGQARGTWYFEAQFPVELVAENGEGLTSSIAEAEGEWMTEDFVPFSTTITFEKPSVLKGNLILKNANPSGLSENSEELTIPVRFK